MAARQTADLLEHPSAQSAEDENDRYLAAIGDRVRLLRKAQGLSRRELSDRSGLSQRFIAQVEAGSGNISVLRLRELAQSLDVDPVMLIAGPAALVNDGLVKRVHAATGEVRAQIAHLLADHTDTEVATPLQARRIALIGLRGAGKSTLGRLVAARLSMTFVELNNEIEREHGLSVGETIALYGIDGYRRLEREQLSRIAERGDLVLAVAGGIVDSPETYDLLRDRFATVWLKAKPEEHMARVIAQGDQRPMASSADAMHDLRRILAAREAHYARADAVVDTAGATEAESLDALTRLLEGKLAD